MSYIDRDKYGMYKNSTSAGPGPALMGADTLIGDSVVNGSDDDLGDIKEIMLDMQTGQVAYAVLAFGGFLGMGEKLFAVPWQALHLDTVNKRFVLNVEKDRLKNAPGFNKDAWPDMSDVTWANQIHSFYGTDPMRSGGPSMGPGVATGGVVSGMGGAGAGQGMGAGMAGSSSGTSGAGGSGVGGAGGSGMGSGSGGSMGSTSGGSLGSSRPDVDLGSSSNLNRDKTGGSDI
jgi:sporulation protein YlmC with PRC-barrel domain